MARRLEGFITVHGTDHEDFGANEHPADNQRAIGPWTIRHEQGRVGIEVAPVRWGGECRVEIDMAAEVLPDQTLPVNEVIRITGAARFFEGSSEDTSELEDSRGFDFPVPRTLGSAPATSFSVPLRNSTVIGAEDHAEVIFSLRNSVIETE